MRLKESFAKTIMIFTVFAAYLLGAYIDQQDEIAAKAAIEQTQ